MDNEKIFYPVENGRVGTIYTMYSRIAFENYKSLKDNTNTYNKISKNGIASSEDIEMLQTCDKYVVSTIIFSALCIEGFLNDYIASCIGDNEFYTELDKLSVMGKLRLIVLFIWKVGLDKQSKYYCRLKELMTNRNALVHAKSEEFDYERDINSYKKIANIDIDDAKKAIQALIEIAELFDLYDKNVSAKFKILGLESHYKKINDVIYNELKTK